MFYAHFVLAKKGPLARIWLAAHWDKKLTKAHVFETNIESSVEGILQPKVKMALRTSGHLLLGIVRIYSRKAKYLLADCNEAFIKIKIAFRPGVVDLPEGNREAAVAAITLPEVFHDFDTALPDITIDMDAQVSLNQSRAEDITIKEDYGNLSLINDDEFDQMGFEEPEDQRDAINMEGIDPASYLTCDESTAAAIERPPLEQNTVSGNVSVASKPKFSLDTPLKDDGFGGTVGEGLLDGETGGLFEPSGLFDDAPPGEELDFPTDTTTTLPLPTATTITEETVEKPLPQNAEEDSDDDMYDMAPGSMGPCSPPSSPESPGPLNADQNPLNLETRLPSEPEPREENPMPRMSDPGSDPLPPDLPPHIPEEQMPPPPAPPLPALDHTTLINNDAESFALAPLDAMIGHGPERTVKAKRKRKLVVDEVKSISGEEMKAQLSDTTDIVATLDLAPPTKRLMHWKETGGVEKLFSLPGHRILSKTLTRSYLRHLTTRSVENESNEVEEHEDLEAEPETNREPVPSTSNKRPKLSEADLPFEQSSGGHLDSSYMERQSYGGHPPSFQQQNPSFLSSPMFPPGMGQSMCEPLDLMPPQAHMQMMPPPPLHQMPPHMMMDPMVNQPLPSHITHPMHQDMTDGLHHSVIDTTPQHLLPPPPDHLHHPPHPSMNDLGQQMMQNQMPPPPEYMPPPLPQLPPSVPPPVDEEATQPAVQYQEPPREVNGMDPPPSAAQTASNNLFDSLIGDMPQQMNQTEEMPPPAQQTEQQPNEGEVASDPAEEAPQEKPNEFVGSDDEDDYGAPASVGPAMPEEQMADETYEQFEERILTKRTVHMLHTIHNTLEHKGKVNFLELVRNCKRKQVARNFYTFLVLKKQQAVELEQGESYGEITITKGEKYDAVYNGN